MIPTAGEKPLAKILVAEDDRTFRQLICDTLEHRGFEVRAAENGYVAKTIYDLSPDEFDLIISDVRMPVLDGVGLLQHVKSRGGSRFLMMTGFSEALEAKKAYELGADEFLSKPFRAEALVRTVKECLNPELKAQRETLVEPDEIHYCQIPIDHFLSSTRLVSDLYIKLSEKKYVKVAAEGEDMPIERLRTYRTKKVEFLHVRREDFGKYVNFTLKLTKIATKSDKLSASQKAQLFCHTSEVLHNTICISGMDKSTLGFAKQVVDDVVKTVAEDRQILGLLSESAQRGDGLYGHALTISVLASLIAKEHGWTSPGSLFKCAVGGLFHDVGKRELPAELITKARLMLTAQEIALLETHPTRSRDILMQIPSLPDEIAIIAYHHHETPHGTGFPQRLTGDHIHPVAKLIGVADKFCSLVFPVREGSVPLTTSEALSRMMTVHAEELDPTFLRRLVSLFPDVGTKAS